MIDSARFPIDGRKLGRVSPGELLMRRLPGGGAAYYRPGEPGVAYSAAGDGVTCIKGHSNFVGEKRCRYPGCALSLVPTEDAKRDELARGDLERARADGRRVMGKLS